MTTIVYLALSWLSGILISKSAGIHWGYWLILFFLSLVCAGILRRNTGWRLIFACAAMLSGGAAAYNSRVPVIDESVVAFYNDGDFVTISGWIVDAPDSRENHVNLRIKAQSLQIENSAERPVDGLLLVQTSLATEYHYGDTVTLKGKLYTPPEFDTFSYRDYLSRQGIYSLMPYAQVALSGSGKGSRLRAALFNIRERANRSIIRMLPDPQASLLAGILLGIETGISADIREDFNAVSATHVIAISGSNLVILAGLVQEITKRFVRKRWWITAITIGSILLYTAFVGADAAVLRAAIMTSLALFATQVGRQTYGLASLSFAAIVMTIINPMLVWDIGFQLSFLATLGLIFYVDPLKTAFKKALTAFSSEEKANQIVGVLSDGVVVSLAAQITTTPIMAYTFERASPLALPVNLLIVPAQPPIMIFGGLSVLASFVFVPLGQILAWIAWLFLSWTTLVVRFFASLPLASVSVQNISPIVIWGIYLVLFGSTLFAIQSEGKRSQQMNWLKQAFSVKAISAGGLIAAALMLSAAFSLPDDRLHLYFIDVGDGNAFLVKTPSGRQVLINAGGGGRKLSTELGRTLPFWDKRLDLLVITTPAQSNIEALPTILNRYQFDAVMTNGVNYNTQTALLVDNLLQEQGAQHVVARKGSMVNVGDGVSISVLYAPDYNASAPGDEAGDPVILLLTYRDFRVLMASRMTPEIERDLAKEAYLLDSTVLLVPRAGHADENSESFISMANPQVAVISVDVGNRSGLPHDDTLYRIRSAGADIYRTDQSGTIHMVIDGDSLLIIPDR